MISRVQNGVQKNLINVESHIYNQLEKYDVKSGLFGQLQYNQTIYEHETVKQYLKQLGGIVDAAKGYLVTEGC